MQVKLGNLDRPLAQGRCLLAQFVFLAQLADLHILRRDNAGGGRRVIAVAVALFVRVDRIKPERVFELRQDALGKAAGEPVGLLAGGGARLGDRLDLRVVVARRGPGASDRVVEQHFLEGNLGLVRFVVGFRKLLHAHGGPGEGNCAAEAQLEGLGHLDHADLQHRGRIGTAEQHQLDAAQVAGHLARTFQADVVEPAEGAAHLVRSGLAASGHLAVRAGDLLRAGFKTFCVE